MKRADLIILGRALCIVPLLVLGAEGPSPTHAQSARFTLIDARNGLTPEVKAAYAEAMGANAKTPFVKRRIKLIVSPRHGANFDPVDLPDHVRNAELDIDLILQARGPLSKPVNLNHLQLARRTRHRIAQSTLIQGR